LKQEYQSYKLRAHAALAKSSSVNLETKLLTLEQERNSLIEQVHHLTDIVEKNRQTLANLQEEKQIQMDQIAILQSKSETVEGLMKENGKLKDEAAKLDLYFRDKIDMYEQGN
jgi:hypothetical protein